MIQLLYYIRMLQLDRPQPITDIYIERVIAQAIADVARQEYSRLASGLQPFEIIERLTEALTELRGLSRGYMPSYNPWVTLCYLTWYQPHHINLAYTILGELPGPIRKTLIDVQSSGRFRWIDFGCGSLPMHVALYAAASIGRILASPQSRILGTGIDSSNHMLRIGRQVIRTINELDPRLMRGSDNLLTRANSMDVSPAGIGWHTHDSECDACFLPGKYLRRLDRVNGFDCGERSEIDIRHRPFVL